jgi:hypothetical protein
MKKLLVLMLVLGLASAASATVMDVVPVDVGTSGGRLGGMDDMLQVGDVIGLKIVLNSNPYAGYPSYDGYLLSSMALKLDVVGPGSLDAGTKDKAGAPVWKYDAGLSPFAVNDDGDISNGLSEILGVSLAGLPGPADLMYDLLLTCTGGGDVAVDLTLAGLTEYAEFKTPSGGPYPEWTQAVDADLGSLVIHQEGVP